MPSSISRRKFLAAASQGAAAAGLPAFIPQTENKIGPDSGPRTVCLGTVSVMDLEPKDTPDMIHKVLTIMENIAPFNPDIICLPEIFAYSNIGGNYQLKDVAENIPGPVVTPFLRYAATHKCYVICPTYSQYEGHTYISAALIDRQGKVAGVYNKMRPAESELKMGIRPGKSNQPVFETDFGKIGIQICFDIKFDDGWNSLKDQGAQVVFWPSAYAAGQEISSRAWRHQLYIVTSTQKDTSKICDITGNTIAQTGRWQKNWTCAAVNLEKAFIPTWPAVSLFPEIQKKYGSRIKITTFSEEEWTIIESLDAGLPVTTLLNEFQLKTMHDSLRDLAIAHENAKADRRG